MKPIPGWLQVAMVNIFVMIEGQKKGLNENETARI
jgi:hypothetical protein